MKVTHQDDFDTHAVMGGKNVQSFEIAQTAEFFTVLSNTLYSNKPLAVIRETMCNAWDSHIDSGVRDIPIRISLDEDNLIIRDYGKGIPPDQMHPIYCIYGRSTKANDGLQTGGFGLGSKAPFAYSDHFTVTTFYKGIKTVYAISRGSAETQGKPDMRVMVGNIPTDEQGVEVNIPIKEKGDMFEFARNIRNVAAYGEMNVIYNDEHIPIVPISSAENNIFISKTVPGEARSYAYIRYGNVIYPIPDHPNYDKDYKEIIDILRRIPHDKYGNSNHDNTWKLIINAKPNSISVTPSRESLSMTDTTIGTISGLLADIKKVFSITSNEFKERMLKVKQADLNEMWLNGTPHKLFDEFHDRMGYNDTKMKREIPVYFNTLDQLAYYVYNSKMQRDSEFIRKTVQMNIESLIQGKYRWRDPLFEFRKMINYKAGSQVLQTWHPKKFFEKQILRPLMKKMLKANILIKNMYVPLKTYGRATVHGFGFNPIASLRLDWDKQFALMKGVVVLASSKTAYADSYTAMQESKIFKHEDIKFVYISPKNKEQRAQIKASFEKMGLYVIDFHSFYDVLEASRPKEEPTTPLPPAPPKPKGIPSLLNQVDKGIFKRNGYRDPDGKNELIRIENPEWIFQAYDLKSSHSPKFFRFGDAVAETIVRIYGHKSGIVANSLQWDAFIEKGAKDGIEEIYKDVLAHFDNCPQIIEYYQYNYDYIYGHTATSLIQLTKYSKILKDKFGVKTVELSSKDKDYVDLLTYFHGKFKHRDTAILDAQQKLIRIAFEKITKVTPAPEILALQEIVEKNKPMLHLLDLRTMVARLETSPRDLYLKSYIEIAVLNALRY